MFVIGATRVEDLAQVRKHIPSHFLLVPGVGAQGGSLSEIAQKARNKETGLLVNASRAVIFASSGDDYVEAAALAAKNYQIEMSSFI